MKKILLLSSIVVLLLAIGAGVFWWSNRPQVVTFSDGAKLTLLKVDYGRRHAPPPVKSATGARARRGNSFTTSENTLVLWIQEKYDPNEYHNFQYYVYDQANTACIQTYGYGGGNNRGSEVVGVRIDAFPRRDSKFYVRAMENGSSGQEISEKRFVISNPARRSFTDWTADSLPATKTDDDLSVTLNKLVAGAPAPYQQDQVDDNDAMNKAVQAVFHVERNGKPVTDWQPVTAEMSDATGNDIHAWVSRNDWQNGDDAVTFQNALWPNEKAWKMRLEFSQQSDFADSEIWKVQSIPVQPGRRQDFWNYNRIARTNTPVAETDMNGFHLRIFPAKEFTDAPPNSQPDGGIIVESTPRLPEGMHLTVAKLTDEQGNNVGSWTGGWNGSEKAAFYQISLQDVAGAKSLNLQLAVHKSRYVEFTAKPEMASSTDTAQ